MPILKDHMVRLVIPFEFVADYATTSAIIRRSLHWEATSKLPRDLYPHIKHLISLKNGDRSIGEHYLLTEAGSKELAFPLQPTELGILRKHQSRGPGSSDFVIRFKVPEVNLYFFESCVGFVVLEFVYVEPESLDAVEMANYQLKKLSLGKCKFLYDKGIEIRTKKTESFSFIPFLNAVTTSLEVVSFFDDEDRLPRHCFLFSYLLLDHIPENDVDRNRFITETLFRGRNGVHNEYVPSYMEYNLEQNPYLLNFVHNIFWGISQEGACCLAYITKSTSQEFFLKSRLPENIRSTYFYLYMLAMAQRFSLLSIARKTAALPGNVRYSIEKLKQDDAVIMKIDALRQDIVLYGLRINYLQVAYNYHYTIFYEKLRDVFRLDIQHAELEVELNNLGSLIGMIEQRKQKNFELLILAIATVFALVSVLSAGLDFFNKMNWFDKICPFHSLASLGLAIGFLLLISFFALKKTGLVKTRKF